jgi:hypothetical protein
MALPAVDAGRSCSISIPGKPRPHWFLQFRLFAMDDINSNIDGNPLCPLGKQFVSTSQGNPFDRPPGQWIPENVSLNNETLDDYSFQNGCYWHKQLREPSGYP